MVAGFRKSISKFFWITDIIAIISELGPVKLFLQINQYVDILYEKEDSKINKKKVLKL